MPASKKIQPAQLWFICSLGISLFLLHHAQPLAVKGPALSLDSFAIKKYALYRVVLRGRIEQPVVVKMQRLNGVDISGSATFSPRRDRPETQSQIIQAHSSAPVVRLEIAGEFRGTIEVRALDPRAWLWRWLAALLIFSALVRLTLVFRNHAGMQALAFGCAYFAFLLPWSQPGFFAFSSDDRYYVPTSLSLLESGEWTVDQFGGANPAEFFADDYRVQRDVRGHWRNIYPVGTSLLSLPLVALAEWLNDDLLDPMERAEAISSLVAKILCAASVALFFSVVTRLTQQRNKAWAITLVFAFVTPQLGTHAGGLWSHNTSVFCAVAALGLWNWKDGRYAAFSAIPFVFGFACRPTMLLPLAIFGAALLWLNRRQFFLFVLLSLGGFSLFAWQAWTAWGVLIPPYITGHAAGGAHGFAPYLGTLFSPNRGLFIYCPILLFALVGGAIAFRKGGPRLIFLCATFVALAEWMVASRSGMWWGGHCYGPRLLCELLPFATLLLLPAWDFFEHLRARPIFVVIAILACGWGIFVQVQALANPAVYEWNAAPNIDFNPARLWSWRDLQIFARR